MQKIKNRVKNKFNVSIAEIEYINEWHKSEIGIAIISNNKKYSNSVINKIIDFIDDSFPGLIEDWDLDIDFR